jgi:hypothetical protein
MLRQRIRRESACGNQAAVEALERQLHVPALPAAGSRTALPPSGRAAVGGWRLA